MKKQLTVADMGPEFTLITDSQEITRALESIGAPELEGEYACLFVEVTEGDYGRVYGHVGLVPYLVNKVYRLR